MQTVNLFIKSGTGNTLLNVPEKIPDPKRHFSKIFQFAIIYKYFYLFVNNNINIIEIAVKSPFMGKTKPGLLRPDTLRNTGLR